jgi:uncharacterized membrane protein YhiD involved in acid resistance
MTLALGLFIFFIYRFTFDGVIYSHRFNASVLLIALITSLIIMTIQSNIVLSLGMVGALSIVRFRTAVKEPMDIVFLFWSIAVGITAGSGLFYIAVAGSIFIGAVMVVLALIKTDKQAYLMVLSYKSSAQPLIDQKMKSLKSTMKSKIYNNDTIELTVKLKYNSDHENTIREIQALEDVHHISLVNYEENLI